MVLEVSWVVFIGQRSEAARNGSAGPPGLGMAKGCGEPEKSSAWIGVSESRISVKKGGSYTILYSPKVFSNLGSMMT